MKNIYKLVGQRIREERQRAGLTLSQLAELSDIHPSFRGYIERNTKKLSLNTLEKIADRLNIPLSTLVKKSSKNTSAVQSSDKAMNQINALLYNKSPQQKKMVVGIVKLIAKKINNYR